MAPPGTVSVRHTSRWSFSSGYQGARAAPPRIPSFLSAARRPAGAFGHRTANSLKVGPEKARRGNWIWFFYKDEADIPVMKEHSNIRLISMPPMLFEWNCLVRILKKKKRFDSIYADDPDLARRIKRFNELHKADTILMGG